MKIRNFTPHALNIITGTDTLTIHSEGMARAASTEQNCDPVKIDGVTIPTQKVVFGEVEGLPEPEEGVIVVVSMLAAQRSPREDVFSPGSLVRDEKGVIIGCNGLNRSL